MNRTISNRLDFTLRYLLLISLSICLYSCSSMLGVSEDRGYEKRTNRGYGASSVKMPSEPGKCYAKCLIQDEYEVYEEDLLVYTGSDYSLEGVEKEVVIFSPATTKWEKKKSPNCRSSDPNDCLIWCMVDVPEISEEYYIVTDTNSVKDFKYEVITYSELVRPGGFTEWKEVICQADVTPEFYTDVQLALVSKGYDSVVPNGIINRETKEALVKFQKDNNLPVGSLDVETMAALGVEY